MLEIEDLGPMSIGATEVAAITPQVISNTLLKIAHKKCVWAQLFRINRDIYGKPGKTVSFPKAVDAGAFTVGVPEKTDISGLNATVGFGSYDATTISLVKIGGYMDITREAIKFSMRDVIKDQIYEAGLQYKEALDSMAFCQMMYGINSLPAYSESLVDSIVTSVSLSPNVSEMSMNACVASIAAIDYCEGTVYLDGSIGAGGSQQSTIYYREASIPGLCVDAARPGQSTTGISAWGILQGKAAMIAQGRDPDVAVMSYNDIPNLLYDEKVNFLDASAYTSHEPLWNAEVGKLWGLKIITESRMLPAGMAIVIDLDRMGYWVWKEDLTTYKDIIYAKDAISYYMYAECGFGVTDSLALCKVMGGTSDYPATNPMA